MRAHFLWLTLAATQIIVGCAAPGPDLNPYPQQPALSSEAMSPPVEIGPRIETQGELLDPRLNEISGIASSRINPLRLWAINDSGNAAELFALNLDGSLAGVWPINANNRDWEALSSATLGGVPYLLIADTGDNLRRHADYRIHLVREPTDTSSAGTRLQPDLTLTFIYPDGARNVESMAVVDGEIVLLSKQPLRSDDGPASRLYRLPINGVNPQDTLTAIYDGNLAMPERSLKVSLFTQLLNIDPVQPTDLAINDEGNAAYVLNYLNVLQYQRLDNESWADAFQRAPTTLHVHGLRQAESLTTDPFGNVWVTSEKQGSPLLAFRPN